MPLNIGGTNITSVGVKVLNDTSPITGSTMYLDAGIANSYPGSGTTWYDLSGNGVNSTLTNGPTFTTGSGGAIVFDGTDDYSTTTAGQAFYQYTNQLTVCWWVKRNGTITGGSGGGQSTFASDNMSTNVWLMHGNSDNTVTFYVNDSGTWRPTSSTALADNTWYHLTGTINTSNVSMYMNGILTTTSSGISTGITNNSNSIIGWGFDPRYSSGRFFNGSIANATVYNRTLSAQEVLQNFQSQRQRFGV